MNLISSAREFHKSSDVWCDVEILSWNNEKKKFRSHMGRSRLQKKKTIQSLRKHRSSLLFFFRILIIYSTSHIEQTGKHLALSFCLWLLSMVTLSCPRPASTCGINERLQARYIFMSSRAALLDVGGQSVCLVKHRFSCLRKPLSLSLWLVATNPLTPLYIYVLYVTGLASATWRHTRRKPATLRHFIGCDRKIFYGLPTQSLQYIACTRATRTALLPLRIFNFTSRP